jgi:hypothetical protein
MAPLTESCSTAIVMLVAAVAGPLKNAMGRSWGATGVAAAAVDDPRKRRKPSDEAHILGLSGLWGARGAISTSQLY